MAKSMSPDEFVRVLNAGGFKPAITREGMVKIIEGDTQAVMFSEGRSCNKWTRIPLEAIDTVEYEGLARCHDHQHPIVRLTLKSPTDNPTAALFAELLIHGQIDGGDVGPRMHAESDESGFFGEINEHVDQGDDLGAPDANATQHISIAFQANGNGTLRCGAGTFACLGRPGVRYPRDITITTADKHGTHYSNEFHVWMNYSILIWGQRGIYLHEWGFCRASGGTSAGCIHLCPGAAATVYNWIVGRTRITISYPW